MALAQTNRIQPPTLANPPTTHAVTSHVRSAQTPNLRERKKARARASILTTANELINQKGYPDTKMREIARAAEVSYQTLYNYFPTKALILQELLTRAMPETISTKLAQVPCTGDPLDATIDFIDGYFDALTYCERDLWREVATELFKMPGSQNCLLGVIDHGSRQKFIRLFSESQGSNQLDPQVDPLLLAGTTYQMVNCSLVDFLSNSDMSRTEAHQHLTQQVRLLLTPYLTR